MDTLPIDTFWKATFWEGAAPFTDPPCERVQETQTVGENIFHWSYTIDDNTVELAFKLIVIWFKFDNYCEKNKKMNFYCRIWINEVQQKMDLLRRHHYCLVEHQNQYWNISMEFGRLN